MCCQRVKDVMEEMSDTLRFVTDSFLIGNLSRNKFTLYFHLAIELSRHRTDQHG